MSEEWLTPQEIADELKVSVDTVYRCIHEGDDRLEAVQVGSQWRVARRALDEWLNRRFTHPERWLTVEQIALRFDCDVKSVRRWLRSGKLQGYQLGERGDWRIKESDLQAFLKPNTD
jgi:excisionase family DNA binding protein